ncbi:MAG: MerR family transcriptional regulator, partial [Actinomycetota bacterium]|nr:MerR family transcriptional regulator [Actinomycetota bacterium]
MLTIGQLTRHTGVPARTIRFYHAKGILPEPARDQSGYRRYTAHDAATLIKIRTMGAAGVPLADIQRLLAATPEQLQLAVSEIEHRLDQRIQELQGTRIRLRKLAAGFTGILPTGVCEYLDT